MSILNYAQTKTNRIATCFLFIFIIDSFFASGTVRLDRLLLKENALLGGYSNNGDGSDIDVHGKKYRGLPSKSFTNFDRINFTSLEGSPIRSIGPAAFRYKYEIPRL